MKTIYSPFTNSTNKYVDIIKRALDSYGIQTYDLKVALKDIKSFEIINLNWFESKVNKNRLDKSILGFAKNVAIVKYLKCRGIKIVYTFHNKMPHDCKYKKLNYKFIEYMFKESDAIVVLCEESRNVITQLSTDMDVIKNVKVIPHPSYINECKNYYRPLVLKKPRMHITFVGAVKKYKNIEVLIEAARRCEDLPVQFSICGKVESPEYKKELEAQAKTISNVEFDFNFLDDEALYRLISDSDLLVLPYDINSSLNSGTLYLAFTLGRTAVCPEIGTVKEFPKNLIYSYNYRDTEEHERKLDETIKKAIDDYINDFEKFRNKGETLHSIVNEKCSEEAIGRKYKDLYDSLVKGK